MTEHLTMIDRMTSRTLGPVLLLAACAAVTAHGQAPAGQPPAPFARLERWAALADAHAPGERDESADAASQLSSSELSGIFDDLQASLRLLDLALDEARPLFHAIEWNGATMTVADLGALLRVPAGEVEGATMSSGRSAGRRVAGQAIGRLLERGALLHADAATIVPPVLQLVRAVEEPGAKVSLLVQDGRVAGLERTADSQVSTHFAFGSRLIDLAAGRAGPSGLTRLWYRATSAYLLRNEAFADAMTHLARAGEVLPADPVIAFLTGALHEVFALPRSQAVVQSVELPPGMEHDVGTAEEELGIAEGHYRRALDLDPDFTLASVHHARVIDLLGNHRAAHAALVRVRPAIADRPTQYFAELFLGDAARGLGNVAAAREHYTRAAALYPRAQTPGLAQSALLRARGDRDAAVSAMRQVLSRRVGRSLTDDPWWTYFIAHVANADELMADVRRALATGGAS